jgi:hypothetical protein
MMTFRALLLGVAIGLLLGGGVMYLHSRGASPIATGNGTEGTTASYFTDELARLRSDLEDLRGQQKRESAGGETESLRGQIRELREAVTALRQELQARDGAELAEAADHDDDSESGLFEDEIDRALAYEERLEIEREKLRQHFDRIDSALLAETVDPEWSDTVSTQVENAIFSDGEFLGVSVSDIDCRSTRCRVEVALDEDVDPSDLEFALAEGTMEYTPSMSIRYLDDESTGARRAVVYLARKGHRLIED